MTDASLWLALAIVKRPAWSTSFALVALSIALSGCGSLRLHSDTRQKQGEAAAAAWKEVDLKPVFAAERDNQAKLLDAETASWNRQAANAHEGEIRRMATSVKLSQYRQQFDSQLQALVGTIPQTGADRKAKLKLITDANSALGSDRNARLSLANAISILQSGGVQKFSCEQLMDANQKIVDARKAKNPDLAKSYSGDLDTAQAECKKIDSARTQYQATIESFPLASKARIRVDASKAAQKRVLELQAEVDEKTIKLNDAQAAYDAEVAQLAEGQSAADKVKEKAAVVQAALNGLQNAADVFGVELASEERIKRIDDLLTSLSKGEALDSTSASKLEIAISMFPAIQDDLSAVKASSKGSAAVPLMLRRDIERARLSSASAQVTRRKQEVELLAAMVEATVRQAKTYVDGLEHLDRVPLASPGPGDNLLDVGFEKLGPKDRRELLESTVYYFDAYSRQQTLIKAMELERLSLLYDTSTDLAEVNATTWVALINASVTQAAEFSSLGIKADDIANILGLLGLFYIGHGVNK